MRAGGKAKIFQDRFYGRQDVYGRKWEQVREDGQRATGYAPVCDNFWKPNCHLKLKDGIRCDNCEIRRYTPVSEDTISKHIRGDEKHTYYVLQKEGVVKFGAMDFDLKPGKEEKGYGWDDVSKALEILDGWNIPYGVARSTSSGFHVYFFLEDFYPANKFRAIIWELYERAGFMEYMRQGLKTTPEIFPKQSYASNDGIGNGITPPMIEPNFSRGRNGFVDRSNNFVGEGLPFDEMVAAQWQCLDAIPRIANTTLDELIAREDIKVHEDNQPSGRSAFNGHLKAPTGRKGGWQPPLTGSIEKVLEGCAAFRKIKAKCDNKETLGHTEGFALFHMSMRTSDGIEWFKEHVPNWGTTDTEKKQLEHSLKKDYSPWTCKKLQSEGLCVVGTVCFKKKPPIDTVEGQIVTMENVPESEWPEPSPVRYAFGRGEDFLIKLQAEVMALKNISADAQRLAALKDIVFRAQVFDEVQQKELKDFIKKNKVAKPTEISKIFNNAADKASEDLKSTISSREDGVVIQGTAFRKIEPYGYLMSKMVRNRPKETVLSASDIWIEEERTYLEEDDVVSTVFRGKACATGIEKNFEIDCSKWHDNSEFIKYFGVLLGTKYNVLRANVDHLRQAATGFSDKAVIARSSYIVTQGWYGDAYLTPSVIVDKDGVRPNTEQQVNLSFKYHAKNIDFKFLQEHEFKEVMLHIKTDMLNTWPRMWSTVALSHALLPAILRPLGLNKRPTLFFEGMTGSGKTELTHVVQHLWGDFEALMNLTSSGKGVMDVGYDFKDAMLVLDDFKGIDAYQTKAVEHVIQYSYDQTIAVKLKRDSTQQKPKGSRAVLMASGEHFITAEASMVARCILIEVEKHNTKSTMESYDRCKELRTKYSGITPRYIHWFLNQDRDKIQADMSRIRSEIYDKVAGRQNPDRIAYNLMLNHLSWKLWVEFMLHSDVVSFKERDDLIAEHWEYIDKIQSSMADRCEEEQNAVVFVRILKQLIISGEVSIQGLSGYERERKPVLGFVDTVDGDPNTAYFYPDIVYNTVKDFSNRNVNIRGTERSIAKQLYDMGVIRTVDKGRYQKLIRRDGARFYVWVVDLTKLGFSGNLKVVGVGDPLPLEEGLDKKVREIF